MEFNESNKKIGRTSLTKEKFELLKFKLLIAYNVHRKNTKSKPFEYSKPLSKSHRSLKYFADVINNTISSNRDRIISSKILSEFLSFEADDFQKEEMTFYESTIWAIERFISLQIASEEELENEFYQKSKDVGESDRVDDTPIDNDEKNNVPKEEHNTVQSRFNFRLFKKFKFLILAIIVTCSVFLLNSILAKDTTKELVLIIDRTNDAHLFDSLGISHLRYVYILVDDSVFERPLSINTKKDTFRFNVSNTPNDSNHHIAIRSLDGNYHCNFNSYTEDTIVYHVGFTISPHEYFPLNSAPLNQSFGIKTLYKAESGYLIKFINDIENPFYYSFLSIDDGAVIKGNRNLQSKMLFTVPLEEKGTIDSIMNEYTSDDLTPFDKFSVMAFIKNSEFELVLHLNTKGEEFSINRKFSLYAEYFTKQRNVVYKVYLSDLIDPKKSIKFELW